MVVTMKVLVKKIVLWILACTFGCIAINAQPSLKEQKVKVEKWDRKFEAMPVSYTHLDV